MTLILLLKPSMQPLVYGTSNELAISFIQLLNVLAQETYSLIPDERAIFIHLINKSLASTEDLASVNS